MAYGDHSTGYTLLTDNATEARILTSGEYAPARGIGEMGTVTFPDKSFIEIRKSGNHQAFMSSDWNNTP